MRQSEIESAAPESRLQQKKIGSQSNMSLTLPIKLLVLVVFCYFY